MALLRWSRARWLWVALALLGLAASARQWHSQRLLHAAEGAAADQRWLEAIRLADQHLSRHPGDRAGTMLLARCLGAVGRVEEAEGLLSGLPELPLGESEWRGEALLRARWWARALPVYETIVQADPSNWNAVGRLAALLNLQGRAEEALAVAARLTDEPSQAAAGHFLCGLIHYMGARPEQASEHWERVLELDPNAESLPSGNNADTVRFLLAESLINLGQPEAARAHLERILESQPRSARALALMGDTCLGLGDRVSAQRCWDRSLEIEPGQCDVRRRLANCELEDGRPAQALELLTRIERECPPSPSLHQALAQAYSKTGDPVQARRHDDEVRRMHEQAARRNLEDELVRQDPSRPEAKLVLAHRALTEGNYLQADSLLSEVLRAQPESAEAHWLLNHLRTRRASERPLPRAVRSLIAPGGGATMAAH